MTDSCRTCEWAYLRREFSRDWNYEACALGTMPILSDEWLALAKCRKCEVSHE